MGKQDRHQGKYPGHQAKAFSNRHNQSPKLV